MARQRRGQHTRIKLVGGEMTFSVSDPQLIEMRVPIEHYLAGARNFKPVFEAYWKYHQRSIERNFAHEGRPKRWKPLAPITIAERLALGFGPGPILVRTGRMKRGFRARIGPRSYRVFNRAPYFSYHQLGTDRIPARPMLVLLPQDKAQFTKLARRYMTTGKV